MKAMIHNASAIVTEDQQLETFALLGQFHRRQRLELSVDERVHRLFSLSQLALQNLVRPRSHRR